MINYEGIDYNLDTVIQFQALKQLLEALAKKQIDHNIMLYGNNNKNIIINNKDNKSNETNETMNVNDKNENKDNENNNDKNKDNKDKDDKAKDKEMTKL